MFKSLDRSVTKSLTKWKSPCPDMFEFLSKKYPESLAKIIECESLPDQDLTFAAEYMGNCNDTNLVKKVLFPLLSHDNPIVREGAVYGLTNHLDSVVKYKLFNISKSDNSKAVREAASNIITK